MKENTETIIAMLEELLTVSKSRQASQSGCTNMDITSIKALLRKPAAVTTNAQRLNWRSSPTVLWTA